MLYWQAAAVDTAPILEALSSLFAEHPLGAWLATNPGDAELRENLLRRVNWQMVAPDVKAKVGMVVGAFQTLANRLSASPGPVTLQQVANDVLTVCNAVMADLPPGTLPPNVVAAITAGEIVPHAVLTVVEQQSPAPT